jgi:hypothetical protein
MRASLQLTASLLLFGLFACGDADRYSSRNRAGGPTSEEPGTNATEPPNETIAPSSSDEPAAASAAPESVPDAEADSGSDAGAPPPADGGAPPPADSGAPPAALFTGAYAAQSGESTNGHPGGNPAGRACFSCHGNGEFSMVMGGTVYTDALGTAPAAQVEVVLKAGATVYRGYTNAQGNFLLKGPRFMGTGKTGARNATTREMVGNVSNGNCNSCHNGTTVARIHVP